MIDAQFECYIWEQNMHSNQVEALKLFFFFGFFPFCFSSSSSSFSYFGLEMHCHTFRVIECDSRMGLVRGNLTNTTNSEHFKMTGKQTEGKQ